MSQSTPQVHVGQPTAAENKSVQPSPRPVAPQVNVDGIPAELRERPQWVCWRYKVKDGKWTKVPYQPRTSGRRRPEAKPNDPATWGAFSEALEAYQANGRRTDAERLDGIGFNFSADDDFVGIDLDNCIGPDGEILPWAQPYIEQLTTYGDLSPSGRGIKFIGIGSLPGKGTRRAGIHGGETAVEAYDCARFFTVTGNAFEDIHTIEDIDEPVKAIYVEIRRLAKALQDENRRAKAAQAENKREGGKRAYGTPSNADIRHDDEALLDRARRARNGPKFIVLYDRGDITGYPSASEADYALVNLVAYWTGPDAGRIERIVSRSALGLRGKWAERDDYRKTTITNALAERTEYYNPSRNGHAGNGRPRNGTPHEPAGDDNQRDEIICGSESPSEGLKTWTPAAMKALGNANIPPRLFQRGGKMTRIKPAEDDFPPTIESLSLDALRGEMDRSAAWGTEYFDKKGNARIRYGPPRLDVVRDVAALPNWEHNLIPRLDTIVETPRFLADGTLLRTPGYHADARLYYAPSSGMDTIDVPKHPSSIDLAWAKDLILGHLLYDFTFANQASRAAAIAFMLLPFVRSLIQGPTPNHHFGASTEGTGKTLALIACSYPSLQREVNLSPQKEDEAEWRKALTSFFMSGSSHFAVDNLTNTYAWDGELKVIDSGTLAMAWTSLYYTDRKLGGNEEARIKIQAIFGSTGNNTIFSRELTRRIVPIDLVATIENPSLRTGFKHDPLIDDFIEPRRFDLLRACLMICQHWLSEGRPLGSQVFGRFESYARVMGGILDCVGVLGFLENRSKMIGRNPEATRWAALAEAWATQHDQSLVTCSELWQIITTTPDLHVAFSDLLGDSKDLSQKQRLGKALEKQTNQVWANWRITRSGVRARNGSVVYRLKPASDPYYDADADEESDGKNDTSDGGETNFSPY